MNQTVTVFCEYYSQNLGDQAIARSLSEMMGRDFDVKMVSFDLPHSPSVSSKPDKSKSAPLVLDKIKGVVSPKVKSRVIWYVWGGKKRYEKAAEEAIRGSALVICGGGQLIKNNIALFCEKLYALGLRANALNVPLVVLGVGVDRKMNTWTRFLARSALANCRGIIVRDGISQARVSKARKLKSRCVVLPDLAFALKNSAAPRQKYSRKVSLAINVMSMDVMQRASDGQGEVDSDTISECLCELVSIARAKGLNIELFTSGCAEDLIAAEEVKVKIASKTGHLVPLFHPKNFDSLLDFFCRVQDVIAMRMHAGILAYISGCNPVCVNWDDKVIGVWSAIGESERVIQIESFRDAPSIFRRVTFSEPPHPERLAYLADSIQDRVLDEVYDAVGR